MLIFNNVYCNNKDNDKPIVSGVIIISDDGVVTGLPLEISVDQSAG
jgi:hypothetical protein